MTTPDLVEQTIEGLEFEERTARGHVDGHPVTLTLCLVDGTPTVAVNAGGHIELHDDTGDLNPEHVDCLRRERRYPTIQDARDAYETLLDAKDLSEEPDPSEFDDQPRGTGAEA